MAPGKAWGRSQVRAVHWRLFQTAGKIARHGRQVVLKISAAMLVMIGAIRERCARFMREGGALSETSRFWYGILVPLATWQQAANSGAAHETPTLAAELAIGWPGRPPTATAGRKMG